MVAVAGRGARRRPDLDAPIVIRVGGRVRSIDKDGRWLIPRDTAGNDTAAAEPDSCEPEPSDTGIG